MISNITKRFINSNKIIINSNRYLHNIKNNSIINSSIINSNNNNNNINSFKYGNNNNNIIKRFYASNNINNNKNNNDSNSQREAFEVIYEAMLKKIEETEKALNDDSIKPIISKKTKTQIILSRHGSLVFLFLCFTFLGTMIYFYFQKRKHTLLSSQVEHHEISTIAELEKLKIDLSKLNSSLSNKSNQNQLVELLITEIIESNNEAVSKLSNKEINDLKLKLNNLILNYQKQQEEQ